MVTAAIREEGGAGTRAAVYLIRTRAAFASKPSLVVAGNGSATIAIRASYVTERRVHICVILFMLRALPAPYSLLLALRLVPLFPVSHLAIAGAVHGALTA